MLHAAVHRGHLEVVNFLLSNGANISTLNGVHLTAMHIAAEEGHLRLLRRCMKQVELQIKPPSITRQGEIGQML